MKFLHEQSLRLTVVYWIRKESHSDILTEGYIGVTDTFLSRMMKHEYRPNEKLKNVFNKYGKDTLVAEIVFEGCREDCYLLERLIRPSKDIGWNVMRGGKIDPSEIDRSGDKFINRAFSPPEADMNQYKALNEYRNVYYSYIRDLPKANQRDDLHRFKYKAAKKMRLYAEGAWSFNTSKGFPQSIWSNADNIYDVWVADGYPSDRRLSRILGYDNRPKTVKTLVGEFTKGWIPHEDERWLKWKERNKD